MEMREGHIGGADLPWEDAGPGVRRQVMGFDDGLMLVRVRFDKGAIGYLHTHPHRQVTYVASGSVETQIGEVKKVLRAGDCYFIPPDVEHGVVALEATDLIDVFAPARTDLITKGS